MNDQGLSFGEFLKFRRKKAGLTLEQLAAKVGSSKGYMHDLENGRFCNPSLTLAYKLSVVLKTSVKKLAELAMAEISWDASK